jgi:hypothetical protein
MIPGCVLKSSMLAPVAELYAGPSGGVDVRCGRAVSRGDQGKDQQDNGGQ